jgi:pimeloyl-ACP methyl ester carboxylesterase
MYASYRQIAGGKNMTPHTSPDASRTTRTEPQKKGVEDRTLHLPDGRRLGYAVYGDPRGRPVFYFHGWPSSRLEARLHAATALQHSVRLIAIDRPGFGLSDFQPHRTLLRWPWDVAAVATALSIPRFAVIGVSGGGPHALACAYKIPERLTSVALLGSLGPLDEPQATAGMMVQNQRLFSLARQAPWLLRLLLEWRTRQMRRDFTRFIPRVTQDMAAADHTTFAAHPQMRSQMREAFVEAYRSGARGASWEARVFTQPWGFRLVDISHEILLWQGEDDRNVPLAMGHALAAMLPHCRATFFPEEGHISLFLHLSTLFDQIPTE